MRTSRRADAFSASHSTANIAGLSGRCAVPAEGNDPAHKCNPNGFPRLLLDPEPVEFIQTTGRLLQLFQWERTLRELWMDGRAVPSGENLENLGPAWYGHTAGAWEGNTLVMNTVGLDDRAWIDIFGFPKSTDARIEERYTRTGPDSIELRMTLYDPKFYKAPWVSDVKTFTRGQARGHDIFRMVRTVLGAHRRHLRPDQRGRYLQQAVPRSNEQGRWEKVRFEMRKLDRAPVLNRDRRVALVALSRSRKGTFAAPAARRRAASSRNRAASTSAVPTKSTRTGRRRPGPHRDTSGARRPACIPNPPTRSFSSVAARSELPKDLKVPPGFLVTGARSIAAAPPGEVPVFRNTILAVDRQGNLIDSWKQWDYLFEGGRGPTRFMSSHATPSVTCGSSMT